MTWWDYIAKHVPADTTQSVIAERAGVDQSTVSRWRRTGASPAPETVIKLARNFHLEPIEALLAAGHITPAEANASITQTRITEPTDRQLLDMLEVRLRRSSESDAQHATTTTAPPPDRAALVSELVRRGLTRKEAESALNGRTAPAPEPEPSTRRRGVSGQSG